MFRRRKVDSKNGTDSPPPVNAEFDGIFKLVVAICKGPYSAARVVVCPSFDSTGGRVEQYREIVQQIQLVILWFGAPTVNAIFGLKDRARSIQLIADQTLSSSFFRRVTLCCALLCLFLRRS